MDEQATERAALARLLRDLREQAGLTQEDVAGRLGVTQSTISKIETAERRLDLVELRQFADAIGLDLTTVVRQFEESL